MKVKIKNAAIVTLAVVIGIVCLAMIGCSKKETPTKLAAPSIKIEDGVVNWQEVTNATGYEVYENNAKVATVTETRYEIAVEEPGVYEYYVISVSSNSKYSASNKSNVEKYKKYNADATQLATPVLKLEGTSLSWEEVENAEGYEVYENDVKVATVTECTYAVNKTAAGAYTYYVIAVTSGLDHYDSAKSNSETYFVYAEKLTLGGGPVKVEYDGINPYASQQVELGEVEFNKYYNVKIYIIECLDEAGNNLRVDSVSVNGNDDQTEDYDWQWGVDEQPKNGVATVEVVIEGPTYIYTKIWPSEYATLTYAVELLPSDKPDPELPKGDDGELKVEGALGVGDGYEVYVKNLKFEDMGVKIEYDPLGGPVVGTAYKLSVVSTWLDGDPGLEPGLSIGYAFGDGFDESDIVLIPDIYGFGVYAVNVEWKEGPLYIVYLDDGGAPITFYLSLSYDLLGGGGGEDDGLLRPGDVIDYTFEAEAWSYVNLDEDSVVIGHNYKLWLSDVTFGDQDMTKLAFHESMFDEEGVAFTYEIGEGYYVEFTLTYDHVMSGLAISNADTNDIDVQIWLEDLDAEEDNVLALGHSVSATAESYGATFIDLSSDLEVGKTYVIVVIESTYEASNGDFVLNDYYDMEYDPEYGGFAAKLVLTESNLNMGIVIGNTTGNDYYITVEIYEAATTGGEDEELDEYTLNLGEALEITLGGMGKAKINLGFTPVEDAQYTITIGGVGAGQASFTITYSVAWGEDSFTLSASGDGLSNEYWGLSGDSFIISTDSLTEVTITVTVTANEE